MKQYFKSTIFQFIEDNEQRDAMESMNLPYRPDLVRRRTRVDLTEVSVFTEAELTVEDEAHQMTNITLMNGLTFSIATPFDQFEAAFEEFYYESVEENK